MTEETIRLMDKEKIISSLTTLSEDDLDDIIKAIHREINLRNLSPLGKACLELSSLFPGTTCLVLREYTKEADGSYKMQPLDSLLREIEVPYKQEKPVNPWIIERRDAIELWEKIQELYEKELGEKDLRAIKYEEDETLLSVWCYDEELVSFFEIWSS